MMVEICHEAHLSSFIFIYCRYSVTNCLGGELERDPADAINRLGKTIALMVTPSLTNARNCVPREM
jgi:hypothetical protein